MFIFKTLLAAAAFVPLALALASFGLPVTIVHALILSVVVGVVVS